MLYIKPKKLVFLLTMFIFLFPSSIMAKNLAVFYKLEGNAEKHYNQIVAEELPKIGFNSADPHHRVNDQYKKDYGSTTLEVLSFLPVVNDENVMPLFNLDPRLGAFSPFNMLIEKKLDENVTNVGHLTPEAMLDIVGIKNKKIRESFIASFKPLDTLLDKEFGTEHKSYTTYETLSTDTMMIFEYEFERPDDMDDFVDEFQNKIEMSFINKKYLIAGFHDFMENENAEEILTEYDIFWAYSLCHMGYSYNMFDKKGSRADAGLFAPCTIYAYVKKGSNKMVVGMPKMENIMDTLGIKESSRVALIQKLDKEIPKIFIEFGMKSVGEHTPTEKKKKAIGLQLPSIPKVPMVPNVSATVVTEHIQHTVFNRRSIKFSKRVPPNYRTSKERYAKGGVGASLSNSQKVIGLEQKGRISAYLRSALIDVKTATKILEDAGFELITTTALDKKKKLISIVFTSELLKKIASQKNKGFLGTLRLLIDPKNNQISITNPRYLAKAMLQENFDDKLSKDLLASIVKAFPKAKNSLDKVKFQLLPKYRFMEGMPYYNDMTVVARGDDLLSKIKNNKRVSFELKLNNGAVLIGTNLGKRTRKFPKRIGTKNAGMLPYPILIENGEAKILDPKYYLSLMYPDLTMEQFMTIATIPDAIFKDCQRVFR